MKVKLRIGLLLVLAVASVGCDPPVKDRIIIESIGLPTPAPTPRLDLQHFAPDRRPEVEISSGFYWQWQTRRLRVPSFSTIVITPRPLPPAHRVRAVDESGRPVEMTP